MAVEERRLHERTPVTLEVILDLAGREPAAFQSRDFSAGGAFLEYSEAWDADTITVGEKGTMSVAHQSEGDKEIVSTEVVITRVSRDGVGVKFLLEDG